MKQLKEAFKYYIVDLPDRLGLTQKSLGVFIYNACRELYHFIGGVLFALPSSILYTCNPVLGMLAQCFCFLILSIGLTLWEYNDMKNNQNKIKLFLDPAFWMLGFMLTCGLVWKI